VGPPPRGTGIRRWQKPEPVVRTALGDEVFAADVREGASLSWDDAVNEAMAHDRSLIDDLHEPSRADRDHDRTGPGSSS
jgi:hypothetical protein